jgi:hypothetical protein
MVAQEMATSVVVSQEIIAGAPERVRRVRTASRGASTPLRRFAINCVLPMPIGSTRQIHQEPVPSLERNSGFAAQETLFGGKHQRVRDRVPRNAGCCQRKRCICSSRKR